MRLRHLVARFADECRLPEGDAFHLSLAIDELVSNVIRHGYADSLEHEIHLAVTYEDDLLTIRVEDDGKPFNPLEAPPPKLDAPIEERPIGGLGVFLVKSVADTLDYRREDGRNILTVTRRTGRGEASGCSPQAR